MLYHKASVIDSVINLTGKRNKLELQATLIETIVRLFPLKALIALKINETDPSLFTLINIQQFDLTFRFPQIDCLHEDESIIKCIERKLLISDMVDNNKRFIFPVMVNLQVRGVLVLYSNDLTDEMLFIIQSFLKIQANLISIIEDGEIDTLTGLLNRRTFDLKLNELFVNVKPRERSTTKATQCKANNQVKCNKSNWLAMLDIDKFKLINDQYGHIYGDEVLLLFSNIMKKAFRKNDLLFRYGGEEFIVVLVDMDSAEVKLSLNRFRMLVSTFNFPQIGQVTVSIGAAEILLAAHPAHIIEQADKALYFAKDNGRNQICLYHHLVQQGLIKQVDINTDIELF